MNVHKDYIYLGLGEPDSIHFLVQPKAVKQGRNRFCRGTLALWRKLHAYFTGAKADVISELGEGKPGVVAHLKRLPLLDWAKPCPKQVITPAALTTHSIKQTNGVHGATLTASADEQPLQCGSRDLDGKDSDQQSTERCAADKGARSRNASHKAHWNRAASAETPCCLALPGVSGAGAKSARNGGAK